MARRPKTDGIRVLGPYRHGDGFRLVIVEHGRKTPGEVVPTEEEAQRLKRVLEKQAKTRSAQTLQQAVNEYEQHMVDKGNKARSITTALERLERFFGTLDRPLLPFTALQAKALYTDFCARPTQYGRPYSGAEIKNVLNAAKSFGRWLVKRELWRDNPILPLEPKGKVRRGKPQLRIDEARRWLTTAYGLADQGDQGAVGALMALLLAMRASEITSRTVRDLDDGGRRLWIDDAKTEAGKRRVKIPRQLRSYLIKAAEGKSPMDPLVGEGEERHWVRRQVRRICRLAAVPSVCAHSMRGLLASLALEEGEVLERVADVLGHASGQVTLMHYAQPGSAQQGAIKRGLEVLEGEGNGS